MERWGVYTVLPFLKFLLRLLSAGGGDLEVAGGERPEGGNYCKAKREGGCEEEPGGGAEEEEPGGAEEEEPEGGGAEEEEPGGGGAEEEEPGGGAEEEEP